MVKSSSPVLYVFRINTEPFVSSRIFLPFYLFSDFVKPLLSSFSSSVFSLSVPLWLFSLYPTCLRPWEQHFNSIIIISFYCLPTALFPHCRHLADHHSGMNPGVEILYSCTTNATGVPSDSCLFSKGSWKGVCFCQVHVFTSNLRQSVHCFAVSSLVEVKGYITISELVKLFNRYHLSLNIFNIIEFFHIWFLC